MSDRRTALRLLIEALGDVDAKDVEKLVRYLELLLAANESTNLVSASSAEPEVLVNRHLRDSLRGLPFLPQPRAGEPLRLLDIGTGGGFPAIPLLVCRPDLRGVLVESIRKKAEFLRHCVGELGLTAEILNARFPEALPMNEPFDLLTTRAVADADRLVKKAGPFLRRPSRALLWTTTDKLPALKRQAMHSCAFHPEPGADTRGLAVLECFT